MPDGTELQNRNPPRVLLTVTDVPIYRVGLQPGGGGAAMCLMHRTREKDPGKGALQGPEWAELRRKNVQRGLLIASYKRLEERL